MPATEIISPRPCSSAGGKAPGVDMVSASCFSLCRLNGFLRPEPKTSDLSILELLASLDSVLDAEIAGEMYF